VVAKEATVENVRWLLNATLANIVVVAYDGWVDDAVDHPYQVSRIVDKAVGLLNKEEARWKGVWTKCGAVLGRTSSVEDLQWMTKIDESSHRFLICELFIRNSYSSTGGSVRLGLVASRKGACNYPTSWKKLVRSAVADSQVRYICGVFSRGKKDTEKLFKELNIGQGALFFQSFWTQHADGDADGGAQQRERAAVAARFEMEVTENVRRVGVYPAYFVVRGLSQDVSVPHITQQPNWPDLLFPHGSGIKNGLGRLVDVPRLPQDHSQVDLQDPLPSRQNPASFDLWRKGIHQLLLCLEHARPQRDCQQKNTRRAWYPRRAR